MTNIKSKLKIAVVMAAMVLSAATVYARMTDEQVVEYVKTATAQGKSQQQIGKELLAKGVTREQVERLKSRYENQDEATATAVSNVGVKRMRDVAVAAETEVPQEEVINAEPGSEATRRIYGHNVFTNRALSFEPNENVATPQNYRLGPGDEIVIDIWGASEDHIRQTLSLIHISEPTRRS